MTNPDIVVVGAGLFGLTIAESAANAGLSVTMFDKRSHIGGNAHSEFDAATNIEVHKYGAHLFHTSNKRVWAYVNLFTKFTDYEHRVWARADGQVYPMPFNLALINQFYKLDLLPREARNHIEYVSASWVNKTDPHPPTNLEEKAISMIGKPLYDTFVKGYTAKQWQTDPIMLSPDIIGRIPVRYNYDTRYFNDTYQGQPVGGYGEWFAGMIEKDDIEVHLDTDWFDVRDSFQKPDAGGPLVVYTGPIDRYFDYVSGELPWRTVDFDVQMHKVDDYQGTAVINECDLAVPYTRTIEFKHFHPEREYTPDRTIIAQEYSRFAGPDDEPYYPVSTPESRTMLANYRGLAASERGVLFGGRLGTYQYLDMHMAIASALTMFDNQIMPRFQQ